MSQFQKRPERCDICHQPASGYNYEVISCNACKMFFRRALVDRVDELCRWDGKCFDGDDLTEKRPKCRHCRFQKCIRLGMRKGQTQQNDNPRTSTTTVAIHHSIVTQCHVDSTVIQKLEVLNDARRKVYSVINICEDPSFCEMVLQESRLGVFSRPQNITWENTERKMKPWGSLGVMLIVEMCKTLEFYQQLLLNDRIILLRNVAFKSHHLSIAYDSFKRKKGRVLTPHDDEMFPPTLLKMPHYGPIMMELVTSPMGPLIDLNLSDIEFLLLNMIVICSPGISGLSRGGQEIISKNQQMYSRLLFQQCIRTHPRDGPVRFTSILSINQRLDRQVNITQRMDYLLRIHWDPHYYFPKIMYEACRMDLFRKNIRKKQCS